jgi:hypothetical protein
MPVADRRCKVQVPSIYSKVALTFGRTRPTARGGGSGVGSVRRVGMFGPRQALVLGPEGNDFFGSGRRCRVTLAGMGDEHDPSDPDRAAILARRRRFIAIAISGLAASGCKKPGPEPCLKVVQPSAEEGSEPEPEPDSGATGPIVEDPGEPLETGETSSEETGEAIEETNPQPCLRVAEPRPCLKKRPSP